MSTKILRIFCFCLRSQKNEPSCGHFLSYTLCIYEKCLHIYLQERIFIFDYRLIKGEENSSQVQPRSIPLPKKLVRFFLVLHQQSFREVSVALWK